MAHVASDQFDSVVQRSGRNLQIGVIESGTRTLEFCSDLAEYSSNRQIIWQDRDGWQHPLLNVLQVSFAGL
jgi:hypothetical protein